MVFKEQEAWSEPGPGMWDWLSHIDSILFECVCLFLSHVCAWPLPRLVQSVIHLSTRLWTLCPSSFYCTYRPNIVNTRSQILPFTPVCRAHVYCFEVFWRLFCMQCASACHVLSTCTKSSSTEPRHNFKDLPFAEVLAFLLDFTSTTYQREIMFF